MLTKKKENTLPTWKRILKALLISFTFVLALSIIIGFLYSIKVAFIVFFLYWIFYYILHKKAKNLYIQQRQEYKDSIGESVFFPKEFFNSQEQTPVIYNKEDNKKLQEPNKNHFQLVKYYSQYFKNKNNYQDFQIIQSDKKTENITLDIQENIIVLKNKEKIKEINKINVFLENNVLICLKVIGYYKEKPIYEYIYAKQKLFEFEGISHNANNLDNNINYLNTSFLLYKEISINSINKTLLKK